MKRIVIATFLAVCSSFVLQARGEYNSESQQLSASNDRRIKVERRSVSVDRTDVVPKSIFVEAAGLGLTPLSLNFETRFDRRLNGWGLRVGGSYYGSGSNGVVTVPIQVNYLLGRRGRYFEMGAGATFMRGHYSLYDTGCVRRHRSGSDFNLAGTLTLGFRYQPVKGGFMFRVGFSPILTTKGEANKLIFVPYIPYLSLGYSF
ncbi:hypothetical protein SAMN02745205_00267 [Porphyromonas cangingivalis]|uniref:Outer membrane protein beta-barrel domain-containing protein n=1 Tax=Porphyromonas cangingivalis TaxID=36874 RepID=A0A1T4JQ47_PORCN|nr:hypothetical protein SAMN02745205_00267 [Porphyromonas cangingivalis]